MKKLLLFIAMLCAFAQGAWAQNYKVWDGSTTTKPLHYSSYAGYTNVVVINTGAELAYIRNNWTSNSGYDGNKPYYQLRYLLNADLDISAVSWIPFGNDNESITAFEGTFFGNAHTIKIKIQGATYNYQGLFARIETDGTVQSLHLTGSINCAASRLVGGITGENYGDIKNCWVSAYIASDWHSSWSSFNAKVGGIAGENAHHEGGYGGRILYCCVTNDVVNDDDCVGGIVGFNDEYAKVNHCTFYGSVRGENAGSQDNKWIGDNDGTLTNQHDSDLNDDATLNSYLSSFSGNPVYRYAIQYPYTVTIVNVGNGAIVSDAPGFRYGKTVTLNVAYGTPQSITGWSEGNGGGNEYISGNPTNGYTFNTEHKDITITANFPKSGWQNHAGTQADPFLINSTNDWNEFANSVNYGTSYGNKYVKLNSDIEITTMAGTSENNSFQGTFLGNNKTLTANITNTDTDVQGVSPFRYINGATIKNLTVAGTISTNAYHSSGLVGFPYGNNLIEGCTVAATLNINTNYAGGFVGHGGNSIVTIKDCAFAGTFNGGGANRKNIGVFWGWSTDGWPYLQNCLENGTYIRVASMNPMGLNQNKGTITNCYYVTPQIGGPSYYNNVSGSWQVSATPENGVFTAQPVMAADGNPYYMFCTITGIDSHYGMTSAGIDITPTLQDINGSTLSYGTGYTATLDGNDVASLPIHINSGGNHTLTLTGTGSYCGSKSFAITVDSDLNGSGTEEDPFIIANASEWNNFANNINNGDTYSGKHVKLTNNISVTTMAGNSDANSFQGIFDGDSHTLTFNISDFAETYAAPFRYVGSASFRNLHVAGTISTTYQYAGGMIANIVDGKTVSIENCRSSVTINSSSYTNGGFVSRLGDNATLTISGCAFDGSFEGTGHHNGGFVGYCQDGTSTTFTHCLFKPDHISCDLTSCQTFWRGANATIDSCYYTQTLGTEQGTSVYVATEGYLGNLVHDYGMVKAYDYGIFFDGTYYLAVAQISGHGTLMFPYHISNTLQWNNFAYYVNNGINNYSGKYVELYNNITITMTVGSSETNSFQGIFNGDGCTLTANLTNTSSSYQGVAPFRYINCATIKNLTVAGTISSNSYHTSGLVGFAYGSNQIDNCIVTATLNLSNNYAGGLLGHGLTSWVNFNNCAFTGTVNGVDKTRNYFGAIWGWSTDGHPILNNCLENGTYDDIGHRNPMGYQKDSGSVTNCYYVNPKNGNYSLGCTHPAQQVVTAIPDNEIARLLRLADGNDYYVVMNATVSDVNEYYDLEDGLVSITPTVTVDAAATPVSPLIPNHATLAFGAEYTATLDDEDVTEWPITFNRRGSHTLIISGHHTSGQNGYGGSRTLTFTVGGSYDGTGTESDPFLITNNDEWSAFAQNTKNDKTYNGKFLKLTAGIDATESTGLFSGTFLGNNQTINAAIDDADASTALFGSLDGGTIKDLIVAGTISGGTNTAALVLSAGNSGTNLIRNCVVNATVTSSGDHVGGFLADATDGNITINGCVFSGKMVGDGSTKGVFTGWAEEGGTVNLLDCLFLLHQDQDTTALDLVKKDAGTVTVSNSYKTTRAGTYGTRTTPALVAPSNLGNQTTDYGMVRAYSNGLFYDDLYYAALVFEGSGTEDDPYLIRTSEQWDAFAFYVNDGSELSSKFFKLTDDINVTTMVGNSEANSFQGTFDGDGHTLTFNYTATEASTAPFRFVKNAVIKNLHVDGTINTSAFYAGGFVSQVYGPLTITNCRSSVAINNSSTGRRNHGGFVSNLNGSGYSVNITGCVFDGSFNDPNWGTSSNAGFVGWTGNITSIIKYSFVKPHSVNQGGMFFTFVGWDQDYTPTPTLKNCFYVAYNSNRLQGDQVWSVTTDDEYTTLDITYQGVYLNYDVSGLTIYARPNHYSPLNTQTQIMFDGVIYAYNAISETDDDVHLLITSDRPGYTITGYQSNPDVLTGTENPYVMTMPNSDVVITPQWTELQLSGTGTENDPYLIGSTDNWNAFVDAVSHSKTFSGEFVKLTNNISVTTKCGTVSGSSQVNPFSGTFDGDGHTITATITDNNNQGTALFCYINGATIKNLTVAGSISSSQKHTAALVGFSKGTDNSIQNCVATADVTCYQYIGGILGHALNSDISINNCVFSGNMTILSTPVFAKGAFLGWGDNDGTKSVTNCLYMMADGQNTSNLDLVKGQGSVTTSNCYKTANVGSQGTLVLTAVPDNEICKKITIAGVTVYSLASTVSGVEASYHLSDITVDITPVVTDAFDDILALGTDYTATLDGSVAVEEWPISVSTNGDHTLTFTGMGNYQGTKTVAIVLNPSLHGSGTELDPYLINNTDEWNLFTTKVNGGNNYNGEYIKLMANIDITTPAGYRVSDSDNKPFSGIFLGNNKTINVTLTDDDKQGLSPFRCINGATIKDLNVTGTITSSMQHAAALVGFADGTGNIIQNCVATAAVSGGTHIGGILGHGLSSDISISDCVFSGMMTGGSSAKGALFGWGNNGGTKSITNCLYLMADGQNTDNLDLVKGFGTVTVTDCYKTANVGTQGSLVLTAIPDNEICKKITITGVTVYSLACTVSGVEASYDLYENPVDITPVMTDPYNASLTLGTDYTATLNGAPVENLPISITSEGSYTLILTGAGNYQGSKTFAITVTNNVVGTGTENDPYIISNTYQWNVFANNVNSGTTYSGEFFKLMNNISVTTMVGSSNNNSFQGTFDGGSNTLTFTKGSSESAFDEEYCAPFRYIKNATIKDLKVAGDIYTSRKFAAGLIANPRGTINITNCTVSSIIHSSVSDDGTHGGIVARLGGKTTEMNITGCVFNGRLLTNNSTTYCGGFVGWWDGGTANVSNSLYAPNGSIPEGWTAINDGATFVRGGNAGDNCYYTETMGTTQGSPAYTTVPDNEICKKITIADVTVYSSACIVGVSDSYIANEDIIITVTGPSDETLFLGTDYTATLDNNVPVMDWPINISQAGEHTLSFTGIGNYQGTKTVNINIEIADWETVYEGDENDPYLIYNDGEFDLLAQRVNDGTSTYSGKFFKLMSDISVTTMVGLDDATTFQGTFDGNGHTLTVSYNTSAESTAPFRFARNSVIKNLHVDGTITTSAKFAGGIVGRSSGTLNITNCRSSVAINSSVGSDGTHGGIVARLAGGGNDIMIEGCIFDGSFATTANTNNCGGFIGWPVTDIPTIKNSLMIPSSVDAGMLNNTFARVNYEPTIDNCYFVAITNLPTNQGKQVRSITGDTDVTVANAGNATEYDVSGITSYGTGIEYDGILYAGNGDNVSLNLSCSAPNAIGYDASAGTLTGNTNPYTLAMPNEDVVISAILAEPATYSLVTDVNQIVSGKHYIIASGTTGSVRVMAGQNTDNRTSVEVTATNNVITETEGIYEFVINGPATDYYTIYDTDQASTGYLYAAGDNNYLKTQLTNDNKGQWTIDIADATHLATIRANVSGSNLMQYNASGAVFSCYSGTQDGLYLFVKNDDNDLEFYGTEITYSGNSIPDGGSITVGAGSVVTVSNTFINGTAADIIIEDGGQLIHESAVNATLQRNISAYTAKGGDGWYLIASPVDGLSTSGLITEPATSYDLFIYNEPNAYWYSNTGTGAPFNTLERGKGYLYANAADMDLDFAGSMIGTDDEVTKTLSFAYDGGGDLKGYNLMGNPFTRNLGSGDMTIGGEAVTSVLLLNNDSDYQTCNFLESGVIKPGQGFFIQASGAGQQLVFNPSSKDVKGIGLVSIKAGDESYIDKAYIQISRGNTLRKMTFSGDKPSVYVIDNGDDYAATTIYELAGSMPVNFKAAADGEYTITVNTKNVEPSTMILFDNFTGEEFNLLESPTYHFKAAANDPEGRFKLIFDFNNYTGLDENDTTNEVFVYQSGDELIVSGDGELKVFDVLGRFVMTQYINGVQRVEKPEQTGVYIFRLNGKTQKMVVR